ncbi:hypothetical protein NKH89_34615 [Mesorhizobium sp. M0923]|uniref:hypothetical protein n=1 Tax=Mesorhizobium sp. M0923 TaxID=2957028 RepID=UPI00333BBEA5
MSQSLDASRSLAAIEQDNTIIAVIEMSKAKWLVGALVPGLKRQPLKKIDADAPALLKLLQRWRDEAGRAGHTIKRIAVAYEAAGDSFWLARWFRAHGIEAYAIHPASGVARAPARQDRSSRHRAFDAAFLGWLRGEKRHCTMAAIPTLEEEDARRPNCERGDPGRRADAAHQPHQGDPRPLRRPQLPAEPAPGGGQAGEHPNGGGNAAAGQHPR